MARLVERAFAPPWWLVLTLALGCVALGGLLIADPFRSLEVLTWVAGLALVVVGAVELAASRAATRPWLARAAGGAWVVSGGLALAWPDLTLRALAIVVGVGLLAGGAARAVLALAGSREDRLLDGLTGATAAIVGVLSLAWPDATVLVLAIVFGVGVAVVGVRSAAIALRLRRGARAPSRRPRSRRLRLAGAGVALALALGGVVLSASIERGRPAAGDSFYTAPSPLPDDPPGTVIRSEVIEGYHPGATTYRVLYMSVGAEGRAAAMSGLVLVPDGEEPPGGRKVVAYTHGTVGVASRCAPSLQPASVMPLFFEGGDALLRAGYVVAAPDYEGLGTVGPHPYLIGASAARSTLDAVRAARDLLEADAGEDFVVWGHSQGGHASLFTGQLARSYAPELRLRGVAAGAPVPDLVVLFELNRRTTVGRALIAMALASWAEVYPDARPDRIVTPGARGPVARIADRCLYDAGQLLATVPSAVLLGRSFLRAPIDRTEPWAGIAARNRPGASSTGAPLLVVQGGADTIVAPALTARLVDELCARGETVAERVYPGVGHVETGHDAAPDVVRWIADRFAGRPAPSSCD